MSTIDEQLAQMQARVNGLQALVYGSSNPGIMYALIGSACTFGCKITEGYSSADMILGMDGTADHVNPDTLDPPNNPWQYPNIAQVFGAVLLMSNLNTSTLNYPGLTVATAPGTGYKRHDIVYCYVGPAGPGVGIAQGTAVLNASTPTDPVIPSGALALARVLVGSNVTAITNANITDLRTFSGRLQGEPGAPGTSVWNQYQGDWSGVTTYAADDGVTYNGSSYISLQNSNTNHTPPAPDDAPDAWWALLASKGDTGPQGDTGDAWDQWLGAWSNATAYVANDAVSYGGSSYICILANTNQLPTNPTYWELIAERGDDGNDGAPGLVPMGAYNAGTTYAQNDWVTDNGSSFYSLQNANTGNALPSPGGSNSWWATLAQKGADGAGSGTVTSVALTMPSVFSVGGSPITASGTLAVTLASQTQNLFWAAPNGSSGAPTFRAIVVADLPTITEAKGGTNQTTYALGDLLYSSATNTLSKLAGNTTTTRKFLSQTGNGSASAAPAWVTLTDADLPAEVPLTDETNDFTASQAGNYVALTDASTIAVDLSLGQFFDVTLGGNRTLGEPTNGRRGISGQVDFYQDGTGSRTLATAWCYVTAGGTALTLTTTKYALDEVGFIVNLWKTSTFTVTIASPGVITWNSHGLRGGQKVQLTTTGALPTGLAVNTTYYVIPVDANTFRLATSLANAQAGTAINTSGSQSGTHTMRAITITLFPAKDAR